MANISSGVSGPWSSPSTWTGGVVPGVGDNVTLAGHLVTVDQDVEVNNLNTTGVGQLELVNSGARTITINGVLSPATTSTAAGIILVGASHTGNTILNIATLTMGAHTGNYLYGIVNLGSDCAGAIDANFGTINGDTHTNGIEPAVFYFSGPCSTDIHISANTVNLNLSRMTDHGGSTSAVVTSTISSDITAPHNGTNTTYVMGYPFIGNFIFEEEVDPGTTTFLSINNASGVFAAVPTVTFMKSITKEGLYVAGANNKGTEVYVHGDVTDGRFTALSLIEINGNYTYNGTDTGIRLSTIGALNPRAVIKGDLIVTDSGTGVVGQAGSTLTPGEITIGEPGSTREYRIEANKGVSVVGRLTLLPGVSYVMTVPTDADWPGIGSSQIELTERGKGPYTKDTRLGAQYAFAAQGSAIIPPIEAVRAGVNVDQTVGTALTDLADLSNVTGGQIASLSE